MIVVIVEARTVGRNVEVPAETIGWGYNVASSYAYIV